ncbi:hypothetical protein BDR05DRAFT_953266 [Suillus weaverae]|nr:hypothetical protein BDR05DRAFT_953266 [Suillus weaverae]
MAPTGCLVIRMRLCLCQSSITLQLRPHKRGERREHLVFEKLLDSYPGLLERLREGSEEEVLHVGELISKGASAARGTNKSTAHIVVVTVPGALIEPVNPEPTFIWLRDDMNSNEFCQVNGGQSTWQISCEALQAACDLLWAKAGEIKATFKTIAAVTPSDTKSFPYQLSDSTLAILSVEASSLLSASEGETITICPLCKTKVANMHNHMGLHILRALNNIPEDINMKQLVSDMSPCGFCGRSGHLDCVITISIKNMATGNAPTQWNTKPWARPGQARSE